VQVVVLMDATDAMTSQTVEARHAYQASDIVLCLDHTPTIIRRLPNGKLSVDYTCFWERSKGAETIQEAVAAMEADPTLASVALSSASLKSFQEHTAVQPKKGHRCLAANDSGPASPSQSLSSSASNDMGSSQSSRRSPVGNGAARTDADIPLDVPPVHIPAKSTIQRAARWHLPCNTLA
jgi:hypothetical protein